MLKNVFADVEIWGFNIREHVFQRLLMPLCLQKENFAAEIIYFRFLRTMNATDFAKLYDSCFHNACCMADSILRSTDSAREHAIEGMDIVQDCFATLAADIASIDEGRNPRSLVMTMVRSRCLDVLRRRRLHTQLQDEWEVTALATVNNVAEMVMAADLQQTIDKCLQKLPPIEGQLFRIIRLEGHSYREAAEMAGIGLRQVERPVTRATLAVREAVMQEYYGYALSA